MCIGFQTFGLIQYWAGFQLLCTANSMFDYISNAWNKWRKYARERHLEFSDWNWASSFVEHCGFHSHNRMLYPSLEPSMRNIGIMIISTTLQHHPVTIECPRIHVSALHSTADISKEWQAFGCSLNVYTIKEATAWKRKSLEAIVIHQKFII